MKKKTIIIVIVLLLLITGTLFYFFYTPIHKKNQISIQISDSGTGTTDIGNIHISYVLNEIGAYQLHTPTLSSNTPKVQVQTQDKMFSSEINKGIISTTLGEISNPDIIITTTNQEIIQAILSSDTKEYIKNSVRQGTTTLELKSSYPKLFSKGYLSLYQELTGKFLEEIE